MHIDHLPVPSTATNSRSHDHQCISVHEVSYTSLVLRAMSWLCDKIEFQGERQEWEEEREQQSERRVSEHDALDRLSCREG